MDEELELAIYAAKEAGKYIAGREKFSMKPKQKSANEYSTQADIHAEQLIFDILSPLGHAFYGEETGKFDTNGKKYQWVVDPIDGTVNFIKGIPLFSVSIALMELESKELQLGVVYNPVVNECFYALNGYGASLNGRLIKSSSGKPSIIMAEHGYDTASQGIYLEATSALMSSTDDHIVIRYGSTALMICFVASGRANAFIGVGDKLYDHAAAVVIAREAGAIISDWRANEWETESEYLLVSSQSDHAKIVSLLKDFQQAI